MLKLNIIFTKIFLMLVLVSFVSGMFILIIALGKQFKFLEDELVSKHKLMAQIITQDIKTDYLANRWPFETLKTVKESRDVLFWWIVKSNGEIYQADDPEMWDKRIEEITLSSEGIIAKNSFYEGEKIKLIISPIGVKEGEKHLILYLGISLESMSAARNEIITIYIPCFILLVGFMSLLSFFLARGIAKPIKDLTQVARRIGRGDLTKRANVGTGDETGMLAQTFNVMMDEIGEKSKRLDKQNIKLKRFVNELAEAKAKDEAIIDSIGEALIATDSKGNCIMINKKAEKLFGLSLKRDIGKLFHKLIKLEDKDKNRIPSEKMPLFQALKNHSITSKVMYLKKVPLNITASPVFSKGKVMGGIAIYHDISKEMEIDSAKSAFVSLASHQLRTPLTSINWILEEILNKTKKKKTLGQKEKEFLLDAYHSSERMTKLVNDLLNISRLDAGVIGVEPQKIDLVDLLNQLIKEVKPITRGKKQKIQFKTSHKKVIASLDSQLISQVITNLLSNAVKYSDSKTTITVTLKKKSKSVDVIVQDQGIGISEKDQKQLFEKFYRSDYASKESTTGTGLGLYIIKKVLTICNGSIKCKSKEGKGSVFTVNLPLKSPLLKKGGKKLYKHRIS